MVQKKQKGGNSKEECLKSTYCLNKSLDQKTLLKYVTAFIDKDNKNKLLYKDFGFYLDNKKNFRFKINIILEKKDVFLYIFDKKSKKDNLSYCLKLKLSDMYKKNNVYYFKKSKVENINRGVCGIKKNAIVVTIDGTYLIKLVKKINKIFNVKTSILDDDARLTVCDQVMKIKLIKLISEGKTWYEKNGGFRLADEKIYKNNEIVQKTPYSYIYDIMKNTQFSMFEGDTMSLDEKELDKTLKILEKYNLTEKDSMKKIIKRLFDSKNTDVKNCDKAHVYKYVLDLPKRNIAYKNKDDKYNKYRNYVDLISSLSSFNESIVKY